MIKLSELLSEIHSSVSLENLGGFYAWLDETHGNEFSGAVSRFESALLKYRDTKYMDDSGIKAEAEMYTKTILNRANEFLKQKNIDNKTETLKAIQEEINTMMTQHTEDCQIYKAGFCNCSTK